MAGAAAAAAGAEGAPPAEAKATQAEEPGAAEAAAEEAGVEAEAAAGGGAGASARTAPRIEALSGDASPCSNSSPGSPSRSAATLVLHAAARAGDVARAEAALDQGARVDKQDAWGLSALHSAALAGHGALVALLLERRAKVDAPSERGQTALHLAATENHDGVVQVLMDAGADVALGTAYGNTALELAQRHGEGGPVEQRIRAEFERRWRAAKSEVDEYRRRLDMAERALETMEMQIGGVPEVEASTASDRGTTADPPTRPQSAAFLSDGPEEELEAEEDSPRPRRASDASAAPPIEGEMPAPGTTASPPDTGNGERPKARSSRKMGYWRSAVATIEELRKGCEAVSARAWVREPPGGDPFPHKGPHVAVGHLLAEIDQEDPELQNGFERVEAAAEMARRREDRWASKQMKQQAAGVALLEEDDEEDPLKIQHAREVLESTGRSQQEWERLVQDLGRPDSKWDWSKIEVQEKRREEDRGKTPGVFAAGRISKKNPGSAKPVYNYNDIVGPMGGMMRRRVRFEQVHYNGRIWVLHDPQAYELTLRAKTTELSVEPLVLDLTSGSSQNRLRHLADARNDPLGLRELLGTPLRPTTLEAVLRPRSAMRRPRSRPRSPLGLADLARSGDEQTPRLNEEASVAGSPLGATATSALGATAASTFAGTTATDFARSLGGAAGAAEPSAGGALPAAAMEPAMSPTSKSSKVQGVPPGEFEAEAAQEAANVKIVEVHVNGWPYVFVVATRTIMPGEELLVDRGLEHWLISRFVLQRLRDVSQMGRDLLLGTKTEMDAKIVEEEAPVSFPKREPRTRVALKEPPRRESSTSKRRESSPSKQ